MFERDVNAIANTVSDAIEGSLRIRGRSLLTQLRRVGRRVPQSVRRDIELIVEAQSLIQNPKMIRLVNLPRLEAAERRILAHLKSIDVSDQRFGFLIGMLSGMATNFLIGLGLILTFLLWQGVI